MTPEQYAFDAVVLDMTPEQYEEIRGRASMRLLHAALGIAGEGGEVVDLIKKHVFGGKPLDKDKIRIECGDKLWYYQMLLDEVGLTLEEVMVANIAKLQARYPDGRAKYQGRDEKAEHEAVRKALADTQASEELGLREGPHKPRQASGVIVEYDTFSGWGVLEERDQLGSMRQWRFFAGHFTSPTPPKVGHDVVFTVYRGSVTRVSEIVGG